MSKPTYEDLDYETQKTLLFTGVNAVFRLAPLEKSHMVTLPHSVYKQIIAEILRWNTDIKPVF